MAALVETIGRASARKQALRFGVAQQRQHVLALESFFLPSPHGHPI